MKTIRIGNAGGYWGDDPSALERQVMGGRLDYISMDFLAEITMSIMQKQRARDPHAGYARDFLVMLEKVFPKLMKDKTRIITNAGGINPGACARAIAELGARMNLQPKIAVVYGDDILADLPTLEKAGAAFDNMETGEKFRTIHDRVESANVYFGFAAVAEALKWDPDIIITGRVTDTGITLAPMVHEFGWSWQDWDKLAAGIVAGHILECGTQSTGGNFSDWEKVPSFHNVGFPIVEAHADGTMVITKHPHTGGLVSVDTIREQLFYEMGNPKAYLTPDVVADFSSIQLQQDGTDRVRVTQVKGFEPTPLYKVSMAYQDGFKAQGSIIISGPQARKKAEKFADIFWQRCGEWFAPHDRETEYFGFNACHRSLVGRDDGNEILLRLGVRSDSKEKLAAFGKLVPSLILSGPPGVAVTGGVPKAQEVVSYWPALMPKTMVFPKIALLKQGTLTEERVVKNTQTGQFVSPELTAQVAKQATTSVTSCLQETASGTTLFNICLGRSGDKGDTSNIGIMARSPKAFAFLEEFLTAQRVKNLFQEICHGKVTRYTLPNLQGFNFLLEEALGGGGTKTLRADAQGKTFAQALLNQKAPIPADVLAEVKAKS